MHGDVSKPSLQLQILSLFNSDMRMAVPVTDRIPEQFDGNLSRILNLTGFENEKFVLAGSRQEHEPVLVAKVLHVRIAQRLSTGAGSLARQDAVFPHQFFIE